jgi:Tol biopolymer transport system component
MFSTTVRTRLCGALVIAAPLTLFPAFNLPLAAQAPASATHIDDALKGLNRGRLVGQVAVSPDGKRLAWLQPSKEGSEIRVAPLDELAKSERVTAATKSDQHCREGQFVWAPDAKALAFFSDCAKPGQQSDLYLAQLDGKSARQLTELNGIA